MVMCWCKQVIVAYTSIPDYIPGVKPGGLKIMLRVYYGLDHNILENYITRMH